MVVAAVRLVYVLHAPITVWQDSLAYMAEGSHPVRSAAIWTGSEPPLVPLLWHITGSTRAFAVVQAVVAVCAWTFLALTVAWRLPGWMVPLLALAAVLVFSLSPFVLQWDTQVLSESLALSAVAALVAWVLLAAAHASWPRAVGIVGAVTAFALDRDEGLILAGSLGAALLAVGTLQLVRGRCLVRGRRFAGGRLLGTGLLVLLVTATGTALALASHRNLTNAEDNLYVRVFPYPSRVAWFAAHGMPEAARVDAAATAMALRQPAAHAYAPPAPPAAPVVGPILTEPYWRPLAHWLGHHGEAAWAEFVLVHPLFDLTAPFHRPSLAYNSPPSLAFYDSGTNLPLPGILWPDRVLLAPVGVLSLALLWARRQRRLAMVLAGLATLGLLTALGAWLGDGQEIARHVLEGNLLVRLAVLIAALAALAYLRVGVHGAHDDEARPRRSTRQPTTTPAPRSAAPQLIPGLPVSAPSRYPATAAMAIRVARQVPGTTSR